MSTDVVCVIGTRPEAIKMAPVVRALRDKGLSTSILATAQHRELLDQMLETFDLRSDWDLDAMQPNQDLATLMGKLIPDIANTIRRAQPKAVLAQGDTATVFCASLASFLTGVPFGHVEAGLRSGDLTAPFPEEAMRRLTAVVTRWHFAPTKGSREALLREGFPEESIHVVGNTVIDALLSTASREDLPWPEGLSPLLPDERLILLTLHRRENFGEPIKRILSAIKAFAENTPGARIIYPVHPNPSVKLPAQDILGNLPNVHLLAPLDYPCLVALMKQSYLLLTDSGGIQEEGPALGKPVLVFRDVTERPEAIDAGGVHLVGSTPETFHRMIKDLWDNPETYAMMAKPRFPYGNGQSAKAIASILSDDLA